MPKIKSDKSLQHRREVDKFIKSNLPSTMWAILRNYDHLFRLNGYFWEIRDWLFIEVGQITYPSLRISTYGDEVPEWATKLAEALESEYKTKIKIQTRRIDHMVVIRDVVFRIGGLIVAALLIATVIRHMTGQS